MQDKGITGNCKAARRTIACDGSERKQHQFGVLQAGTGGTIGPSSFLISRITTPPQAPDSFCDHRAVFSFMSTNRSQYWLSGRLRPGGYSFGRCQIRNIEDHTQRRRRRRRRCGSLDAAFGHPPRRRNYAPPVVGASLSSKQNLPLDYRS